MMIVQLIVVSILSLIMALLLEVKALYHVRHVFTVLPWILFVAIAEGLGFTLMALGQTYSPPTHAALILSLEGVFASIFSYMVLGETLTPYELTGCMLMLVATYIAKMGCCG
ncbi:EamA/RhaT family transporter, partial [archaeon]